MDSTHRTDHPLPPRGDSSPTGETLDLPALFQGSRLGSWSLDVVSGELTTSAVCRNIFGRGADDRFGYDDLLAVVYPDDRPRMRAAIDRSLATGCDCDIEYRILVASDEVRWVHFLGQIANDANGSDLPPSAVPIIRMKSGLQG